MFEDTQYSLEQKCEWNLSLVWLFLAIVTCYLNCLDRLFLAQPFWTLATFPVCLAVLSTFHGYKMVQLDLKKRNICKKAIYVVWQKSNESEFLLTMNFILFTNQGYPLQNSSLGQLHSNGGVVSIVRSSAGRLLPSSTAFSSSVTLFCILSKVSKWRLFKWFLSRRNKNKSQGLRSGE